MANIKFTEFPSATVVGSMDIIPIVQDGANKKTTASVFSTYIGTLFVNLSGTQTITGSKTFSSQLISSVATGTAPFSVASTTKVTNLNADLLDGYTSADFQLALTNPITGTGTTNYLPKFTGASALGNSIVSDNGTRVTIDGDFRVALADANINLQGTSKSYLLQVVDSDNRFRIYDNTANAERFAITSAGNVGIGTTSPSERLSVASTDEYLLSWQRTGDSKRWAFGADSSGTFISNRTDSVLPLFIKNSGNVLIGTITDAGYKLDVNGSARVSGALGVNGQVYGGTVLTLQESGSLGAALAMTNRNSNQTWGFAVDTAAVDDKNFGLFNFTSGNFPLIINASTGAATFSGQVNIGNPVAAAVAVASTHKVEIVIGGTTYYLLATT